MIRILFPRLVSNSELYSTVSGPAVLAGELTLFLNSKYGAHLGIPYSAWRENDKVYLSTIPDFTEPQRTLEFDFVKPWSSMFLTAIWTTKDKRYEPIAISA